MSLGNNILKAQTLFIDYQLLSILGKILLVL